MIKKFLLVTAALVMTACSNSSRLDAAVYPSADETNDTQLTELIGSLKTNKPQYDVRSNSIHSTKNAQINNKKLMQVYSAWAGTRYRLGGTTTRGIDCSAFMQEAFSTAFGIDLPRSTSEQRSVGKKIQKSELKQGDLVFFRGNRHVGVYLGGNRFMHSSTKEGVTISSLDDGYWSRTYTQSRRVL
ncbi:MULTISPECIES: NlpC/P60 family protein [Basfia]|nr:MULTISPECIES: NlpC/P60 family protein [Basfia]QIM69842.1 endopeptidase [Basfia succiniciproducens]SCX77816.1 spr peptidase. Cysteine peptidase. MEROPS family C40 [Basfia succiniciproducens]SEQ31835.1 spr peptidase. Cysteine peptidase. MEROPS family C40 [Basfia succiniciproducens]